MSELVKIPKFSNIGLDAVVNILQDNPEEFDIKALEDKAIPYVRLASLKNNQIMSDIGREIINSGETKQSKWYGKEYKLPTLINASKHFEKKYNTSANDFVEFLENYMVGRNVSYEKALEDYEKFLKFKK